MITKSANFNRSTSSILLLVVSVLILGLFGVVLRCMYLQRHANSFLERMNSFAIGSTSLSTFMKDMDPYKKNEGVCNTEQEHSTCYSYGFSSPLLVRLHILPDTILIGTATFEDGMLKKKTEFFKSGQIKASISEALPSPFVEFNSRPFIANSTGSPFGLLIQVNPEAKPEDKAKLYRLQLKCFLASHYCRIAQEAVLFVTAKEIDMSYWHRPFGSSRVLPKRNN